MSKQKAFTLIELLVIISIISILAGFISIQINNSINSGKDAKRKSDIELLGNAIISYSADHYSRLPIDDAGCTIDTNCSTEINEAFKTILPNLPIDPDSGTSYSYKTINNGLDCEIKASLSTGQTYKYSCGTETASTVIPVAAGCGTLANTSATGYATSVIAWPGSNFCAPGTVSANPTFPTPGTSVTWTCFGQYLGSNAVCTAYRALDGACGTADYRTPRVYADADTAYDPYTICAAGTASPASPAFPAKGNATTWSCAGINNGTTASCEARHMANGVCGTATRTTATAYATGDSAYSGTICAAGTASPASPAFPIQGGSTTWSCNGVYGGTNINTCIAYHSKNGACGTANAHQFADADTAYDPYTICAAGTASPASPAFPAKGGSTSWDCLKIYNGTDVSCSATRSLNGVCGTAATAYATGDSAYSGTFCTAGTASPASPAFPAQNGSTVWSCNGSNGGTNVTNCTATRAAAPVNGVCGTRNKTYAWNVTTYGTDTTCSVGTASPTSPAFPNQGQTISWTCAGSGGGTTASCSATRPAAVNGQCAADCTYTGLTGGCMHIFSAGPTESHDKVGFTDPSWCYVGTPTNFSNTSWTGPWTWQCAGANGGTTASCSASKGSAHPDFTCGNTARTVAACQAAGGYVEWVTGSCGWCKGGNGTDCTFLSGQPYYPYGFLSINGYTGCL